ncbi:myosin-IIIb-like isoform X2 [Babylonia areolata]|uniref:myosin-IIIb-like isoform X2 n=1 Tax=Babylonia areolata TaxID=304850 RepID=UPI003FD3FC41
MLKMYNNFSKVVNFEELSDPSDHWELGPLIGEGTYGEVFKGFSKNTGEEVAIKVLESIHEMIEEIEEEFQVLRDLSEHPNMPKFHGIYLKRNNSYDDQIWLVMELCGGGSVTSLSRSLLKKDSHLGEHLIAHIIKETVHVLHHLHEHNVMHRDVKGHNILITHSGVIKIIDFGVSGHLESHHAHRKTHVGTPYWMAPEVIACEQQLDYSYDVRCDVWSLGITAIELAEGKPPHADVDPRRALFKIPRSPPPKLSHQDLWSAEFHDFLARCLVKDFEQRPFTQDLLSHPFLQRVPRDTAQLRQELKSLTSQMEHTIHAPDVTTKHGQLKSGCKSRKDNTPLVDDLAALEVLDEEVIVNQLLARYEDDIIYTYIGDILLAVNPFTPLTIYTEEYSRKYMHAAKADNPPHIFAVADQSYQSMMHNQHNQCIVISGESGAGKTESANLLVQQLTQLGKAENRRLEERILQVNPLMEAFGNAKTVINDNSSRFGKYLEMFFTSQSGTVVGAKITEYLLEKSRVIYQAVGEQNFHIFYYVHDGLFSHEHEQDFHLKQNTTYRYIQEYTSQPPDTASISINRVKFKAIQHCFDIIGFQPEEVKAVYCVLVAILHTGNVDFVETDNHHGGDSCTVANTDILKIVSDLLGLDAKDLQECLTTTGMVAKGEVIVRANSVQEAMDARDAMSKALYGRLFSWIVNRISALLKPSRAGIKEDERLVTGLLDIFGFENFKNNSFEQLCINIANEQIQYYFNQHIFAWELAEYEQEEIDARQVTYVDNRPILDMFLAKPVGLLSLLDEESHFPKASDQTLVDKFQQNIKAAAYSKPKGFILHFCIDHFAGKVEYDATGFLEKNRDRLPVEIVNILRTSDSKVVRTLFQTPLTKTGNLSSGTSTQQSSAQSSSSPSPMATIPSLTTSYASRSASVMGGSRHVTGSTSMTRIQQTVATYFRFSLMDLLNKMVAGTPHFVRCIKPNDAKEPGNFDPERVETQLRYTGVLETTRIRRQGYSHRILFSDFLKRYHLLALRGSTKIPITKENCALLLEKLGMTHWAIGKTKVFLKYYHIEELARLYERLTQKVVVIQCCVRSWLARTHFFRMRWERQSAALVIQKHIRGWSARQQYKLAAERRNKAATTVQKVVRGHQARKQYQPQLEKRREAATSIQVAFRKHRVRTSMKKRQLEKAKKEQQSAEFIQRMYRMHRLKKKAQHQHMLNQRKGLAATVIQTYFRMWRAKTLYRQLTDYKGQKEIQLIYFGQQVELYNRDMVENLQKADESYKASVKASTSAAKSPAAETTSMEVREGERAEPSAPMWERVDQEMVGEARIEQMRKMHESKSTLPTVEANYYDSMNGHVAGSSQSSGPPAVLVNGEAPITPKAQRKPVLSAPTQSQDHSNNDTEDNNNLPQQDQGGVDSSEGTRLSRLLLARSAAHTLMANKPGQPEVTVTAPMPEEIETLSVPWDAPLLSARQNALKPEIDGSGYISPCSIYSIEADLTAEKDEFLSEEDKHELAQRLEGELAGSILELWRERLNQPMMGSDIEIAYDTDDDLSTASQTPHSMCSRSPATRSPNTSLGPRAGSRALAYLKGRRSRTGSIQSDDSDEGGNSLEIARMRLRKTRFDYDQDALRQPKDVTPQQVDFRHVLKKGAKPLGE